MPLKAPPIEAPPPSWTGFYLGGNVGADWTSNTGTWSPLPSPAVFGVLGQGSATGGHLDQRRRSTRLQLASFPYMGGRR
jgi:hypothetical protein